MKGKLFGVFSILLLPIFGYPYKLMASDPVLSIQLSGRHDFRFAGFYQALWQGYYREAGIAIELRSGIDQSGKEIDALRAVASGQADLAPLDGLALLVAQDQGAELIALQPVLQNAAWAFYSLPDNPLQDVRDFAGKKVAISADGMALYKLMLRKAGIPFDSDLVADVLPGITSLLDRSVDIIADYAGGIEWEARQHGLRLSVFHVENHGLDFYGDVVAANYRKFEKSSDLIERFLQATARGWQYAFDHRDETIDRIIACFPRGTEQNAHLIGWNHYLANRYLRLAYYPETPVGENDVERWRRVHAALKTADLIDNAFEEKRQVAALAQMKGPRQDWILPVLLVLYMATAISLVGWFGMRRSYRIIPFALVILTLVITWSAVVLYRDQEMMRQREQVLTKLLQLRVRLEESINSNIFLVKGLVAYIQSRPELTQQDFEQVARSLLENNSTLRNLAAAPDLVIRMVYPVESNQQVLDLDYRSLPGQIEAVLRARDLEQIVLAGPVDLVQQGAGMIGRMPVYISGDAGQRQFWGMLSTVMQAEALYRAAGLHDSGNGLQVSIRGKDGKGSQGEVFFGQADIFDQQAVTVNVTVPGGYWQLGAVPVGGWVVASRPIGMICLLGVMHIVLIGACYYARRNHEDQQDRNEQHILHLAYHDSLTRLPNRVQFTQRLQCELAFAQQMQGYVAVLLLDLDYFKQINDMLGHAMGDRFLRETAGRLEACLRKKDFVARLGGDEFAILQHHPDSMEDVSALARKLIDLLARPYTIDQTRIQSGASIGIACWQPGQALDVDLLEQADTALYEAKNRGRGNFVFHTSDMTQGIRYRLALRNDLKESLHTDDLFLVFQPKIDTRNDQLVGLEVLLRWRHPVLGIISPAEFIPVAETHGLMHALGFRVLRLACEAMSRWRALGVAVGVVSINLSPLQLDEENFDQKLLALLTEFSLPGHLLELELTERIMIEPRANVDRTLHNLAQSGMMFSIDDFGTGYSSLLTLKRWPFHCLKIAQEFVRDMLLDPSDQEIVKATIMLARNLGLDVIAEGVETAEQLAFLKQHGCYLVQGHLLARPMAEVDLLAWLRQRQHATE